MKIMKVFMNVVQNAEHKSYATQRNQDCCYGQEIQGIYKIVKIGTVKIFKIAKIVKKVKIVKLSR